MIPKNIHQYYPDQTMKDMPVEWAKACDTWHNLNPEWNYRRWSDSDIITLLNHDKFMDAELYCSSPLEYKSALVKYELLNRLGGLWVDLNFKCLKPLPEFENDFLGEDYRGQASCKIMASDVNSDFTNSLIHIASLDTPNKQRANISYLHLQKLEIKPEIKPRSVFSPNNRDGKYVCKKNFPLAEYIHR